MRELPVGVVGGGIVGLAIACEFTRRFPGREVLVFEKAAELATHQTGHNGPEARKAGHITVSIDDDGNLIDIAPTAPVNNLRGVPDYEPHWPTWTPQPLR